MTPSRYHILLSFLHQMWMTSDQSYRPFPTLSRWMLHIVIYRCEDDLFDGGMMPASEEWVTDTKTLSVLQIETERYEQSIVSVITNGCLIMAMVLIWILCVQTRMSFFYWCIVTAVAMSVLEAVRIYTLLPWATQWIRKQSYGPVLKRYLETMKT